MKTVSDMLFEIALARGRYSDPRSLSHFDTTIYSQRGQDGWIAEIFRRIGVQTRFFVEIGIGDGTENNTRLLLEQGWSGMWIESDPRHVEAASRNFAFYVDRGALRLVDAKVTAENVDRLLHDAGAPEEYDFLSLDVDYGTSHLWRAMRHRSRAAAIEYNASVPPSADVEVPYDPTRFWDGSNWFGAGLKTLEKIGVGKGMDLVGCDLTGTDCFFVAGASPKLFREPFVAEEHWEPARYHTAHGFRGHPRADYARSWAAETAGLTLPSLPADFDAAGYLAQNRDVAASGMQPADHYLAFGFYEGRRWKPLPA